MVRSCVDLALQDAEFPEINLPKVVGFQKYRLKVGLICRTVQLSWEVVQYLANCIIGHLASGESGWGTQNVVPLRCIVTLSPFRLHVYKDCCQLDISMTGISVIPRL
jgi:hypothetical protein